MHKSNYSLLPPTRTAPPSNIGFETLAILPWLKELKDDFFLALWLGWPGSFGYQLPDGFEIYVVSFHLDAVDVEWLQKEHQRLKRPIIVLWDSEFYDYPFADGIIPLRYICWHHQIDKMLQWYPNPKKKHDIRFKSSAHCSRITQSKLIVITALLEYFDPGSCLISLSNRLEEKDVHRREKTNNRILDSITEIFWDRYYGTILRLDDYYLNDINQYRQSDCWIPTYTECALNFTNESYHYSSMEQNGRNFIMPGPFITEKTLKCLVAGTGMVPIGQFDSYGALSRLGLKFDYQFDTSWDQDPGNLSRLESIVNLIKDLSRYSAQDLYDMVKESSQHNQEWIFSGNFAKKCEQANQETINKIFSML